MIRIRVSPEPIDLAEIEAVEVAGAGAVASFVGRVRADDGVASLTLEHYPGMTEAALEAVAQAATERWSLSAATIVHRVGPMAPGERIVLIAVAAAHRTAALEACAYCIDRLKTDAPFWKREATGAGERWVEARAGDADRAAVWDDAGG
ncbi:molybdenum cofactor biosynthesis protein MoaE [Sphingomonas sp. Y38-1Y]|uniref:molybdenum cofactor biosynthesis protein MoaE n=1 Tax=Sphingomonas sp. Y38-1Y TaxID=3078265 RepID=UPI0028E7B158|nr:molybdenum cofactor biosynthesis protein MoaE [Sphingomonas sp. Y38-1Y]